jgi:hypothetical protein
MKVRDLIEELEKCKTEYGEDFLDWDVYTEQLDEMDKNCKLDMGFGGNWETVTDSDEWLYFMCHGYWTKFPKKRIFTINVNY